MDVPARWRPPTAPAPACRCRRIARPLDARRSSTPRRRRRRSRCSSTACWCTPGTPTGSARATCSSGPRRPSPCWRTSSGAAGRWTWTPPSTRTCRSWRRGYRGVPVRDVARMTSGVDWVEDHRDPDGPATALVGGVRHGRLVARAAGPGRRALPARHPLRVLHGRLAGARLGARARHRRRASATRSAELWRDLGCTEDAWSPSTATAWRWPAAAWPPRPATGPGSACSQIDGVPRRGCSTGLGRAPPPVAAVPARPAGSRAAVDARRVRLPLVAAGRRAARAWPPTAAAASSSTSTGRGARSS